MGFFKKKPDPISDRSRALEAQIAALEAQIEQLNSKVQKEQTQPRVRSSVLPNQRSGTAPAAPSAPSSSPASAREPIFELISPPNTPLPAEESTPGRDNDLGVRKYDLAAAWRRIRNHFHGPATPNPKLVNYLAAGTIKGLRPLRYEKRIARNRVIFVSILLLFVIWVVLAMALK
jgi:TolA-binding protein